VKAVNDLTAYISREFHRHFDLYGAITVRVRVTGRLPSALDTAHTAIECEADLTSPHLHSFQLI
jgi:hypothetical protein